MGIRDRLKRRLGRGKAPTEPATGGRPAPSGGPIRARIDYAEERERAAEPPPPPPVLPGPAEPGATPADPPTPDRFEDHPVQHAIQVTNPEDGTLLSFTCAPGETVLDAAERAGLELPYSCRAGGCLSCSAKTLSGEVTLDEQFVLDEEHLTAGFVLLCGARAEGPCEFLSHQQEAID